MSKDPAFLFYASDFLTGTMFMSDDQVGKYVKLLCAQHQHGRLTKDYMMNICKTYDKQIFNKFECIDGLYFNKRLEEEKEKREKYSESRRKNRLKGLKNKDKTKNNTCSSYERHMENENENRDEDINNKKNKRKKMKKPTLEEVKNYCRERNNSVDPEVFFNTNEANGWVRGKYQTPIKDWKAYLRNWERNNFTTDKSKWEGIEDAF